MGEAARAPAELMPNTRLRAVDDAHVLTMLDRPTATTEDIGAFLAGG